LGRPYGTWVVCCLFPALKRWANIACLSGANIARPSEAMFRLSRIAGEQLQGVRDQIDH